MRDIADILKDWEPVIGLEIHTELTTLNTKMFCSCRLSHDDEPNTNVCPVCLGMPGALPVPNRAAIQSIVLAGLSTNCQIMKHSMFYRKNYFYPDMAKNFQTTQGPVAFCMGGWLDVEVGASGAKERLDDGEVERAQDGSYTAHIGITRIHMEEDAAKMVHVGGAEGRIGGADHSLIDYNRCGTPLIELVTEPDLRSPEEARLFMEKLRQIFLTIGISDCSMESGSMRCDGNISLRRRGTEKFGTRCEMKNLNSFKNLHDALEYEIRRQAEVLEEGGVVYQETRHWDVNARRTIVMRTKETADDYRLFPEPDMVPFDLSEEFVEEVRTRLPELPDQRRDRYVEAYGLKRADAAQLAGDPKLSAFFDEAVAGTQGKLSQSVANVILNELMGYLNAEGHSIASTSITPAQIRSLAELLSSDAISSNQGREVFVLMAASGDDPAHIVDERGMRQVSDTSALEPVVDEVIANCPDQVAQYKGGNTKVVGYLVGQCMKASKGKGNPKLFNQLLCAKLAD